MEQAIILLGSFTGIVIAIGIIGLIYYFYDEKRRRAEHSG